MPAGVLWQHDHGHGNGSGSETDNASLRWWQQAGGSEQSTVRLRATVRRMRCGMTAEAAAATTARLRSCCTEFGVLYAITTETNTSTAIP